MQTDAYQAARNLTRGYLVLAMFLLALMALQFFMGESLGVVRKRELEPKAFWAVLGVQAGAFILLIVLLFLHAH